MNHLLKYLNRFTPGTYGYRFMDGPAHLPAQIHSIGWQVQTSPSFNRDGKLSEGKLKGKERYIFLYTISGWGMVECDGQFKRLEPGNAALVQLPGDTRFFLTEESKSWEFIFITLFGSAVAEYRSVAAGTHSQFLQIPIESPVIRYLMKLHNEALKGSINDSYQASGYAFQFVMELYRTTILKREETETRPEGIEKALQFMQEKYSESIGLQEISEATGISKYHFARLFHKTTGMSTVQYLTKVRMEKAISLLRSTDLTIHKISRLTGFSSHNYFRKVFRKMVGTSPAQFRENKHIASEDYIIFN